MAKGNEKYISFRASEDFKQVLEKASKGNLMNVSSFIKKSILDNPDFLRFLDNNPDCLEILRNDPEIKNYLNAAATTKKEPLQISEPAPSGPEDNSKSILSELKHKF